MPRLHFSAAMPVTGPLSLAVMCFGCSTDLPAPKIEASKQPIVVNTVTVVTEEVERTTIQPATVHAFYRAEIRAKVSGYVRDVQTDIGDFVEAGATLAVIHIPEMVKQREVLEARITRHESEELQATAGVQLAEASVRSSEAKLAQSKSELSRADASLAAMQSEFDRTLDLVERRSLESRLLDEVRKKRDSELANKQAMTSAITSAEAEVAVARAKVTAAEADLRAAQAETAIAQRELEALDVLLAYATLKAPFSGIVTYRSINPGDLVREGSEVGSGEPLFTLSQVDKVRIQIPVPEADAALVSQGDPVALSFPSFPAEESLVASVTRFSGDLDPSTRTMLVEAVLANPERKLIPGMFGQATITLSTKVARNMLPARAIRFEESGKAYVYIVGDDQAVTVTPVTIGIDTGRSIEVTSGVAPGQQVIDAHLQRFVSGQTVTFAGQ